MKRQQEAALLAAFRAIEDDHIRDTIFAFTMRQADKFRKSAPVLRLAFSRPVDRQPQPGGS